MEPWLIGLIMFGIMMLMVFAGIPIFLSMLSCAFAGFVWLYAGDFKMALNIFTTYPFELGANYNYAVLPMFMLVGALAGETGIAEGAFKSVHSFLGRIKGGLLFTVVGANAFATKYEFTDLASMVAGFSAFGNFDAAIFESLGFQVSPVTPPETYEALDRILA